MLSKGKGPVVVLPGEGAFRLASGAAVELHGLPLEFADSQRLFGKDGETKCFKLLGLSAVASSLRPLQCIARSLELFKRCTEGDDGADGGEGGDGGGAVELCVVLPIMSSAGLRTRTTLLRSLTA